MNGHIRRGIYFFFSQIHCIKSITMIASDNGLGQKKKLKKKMKMK